MLKPRIPEIFLGALLAAAIFAIGFVFGSLPRSDSAAKPEQKNWWNDPVADFTLGLVFVGLFQAGLFYVQLRLIRESLEDAKQAADATTDAAAAATRQAKVAEDSLTKLERPYIFIFNLSPLSVDELEEGDGAILSVTYSVANYGKIPAIIKFAQATMAVGENPPFPDRLPESHTLIAAPILAAGEARHDIAQHLIWSEGTAFDEDGSIIPSIPEHKVLFLWIIITYRGPFTDQHETRACWIYNENTGRFNGPWGVAEYSGEK